MLVFKFWRDTSWRFLIGLTIALSMAALLVFLYPRLDEMVRAAADMNAGDLRSGSGGPAIDTSIGFRSYVFMQWGRQGLMLLLAIVLGAGSGLSPARGGGALFTLALPTTRRRIIQARAATGLAELFVMIAASTLLIAALAPTIGEFLNLLDAIVLGVCIFVATSLFFSLTLALSTAFSDMWRPTLITFGVAMAIGASEGILGDALPLGIFRTLAAGTFFDTGELPWIGLLVCAAGTAALIYATMFNLERRDF